MADRVQNGLAYCILVERGDLSAKQAIPVGGPRSGD
jgi:hypothetical protein